MISLKVFPGRASTRDPRYLAYVAGVVGAFMAAFATTFWDNAVEAEVYAASCALMAFVIWLVLRWEERADQPNADGLLLVITYLVGLGVGIHLGVAIAAWATVIYVFVTRPPYLGAVGLSGLGAGHPVHGHRDPSAPPSWWRRWCWR